MQPSCNPSELRSHILDEDPFPLPEAPNYWPRTNGRKPHKSLVYRAAKDGVDGIRLEVLVVGSRFFTSKPAIARFFSAVTAARLSRSTGYLTDDGIAGAVLAAGGIRLQGGVR